MIYQTPSSWQMLDSKRRKPLAHALCHQIFSVISHHINPGKQAAPGIDAAV